MRVGTEIHNRSLIGRFIVLADMGEKLRIIGQSGGFLTVRKDLCEETGRHFEGFEPVADAMLEAMDEWKGAEE